MKVTIEVDENQARLIQRALDFYSRVGIGQMERILEYPTFEKVLAERLKVDGKTDWSKFHDTKDKANDRLHEAREIVLNTGISKNGSYGIFNPDVDESCRVAYDILQVVRHEFWKQDPDRSDVTVDSSAHLSTENSGRIKVKIE